MTLLTVRLSGTQQINYVPMVRWPQPIAVTETNGVWGNVVAVSRWNSRIRKSGIRLAALVLSTVLQSVRAEMGVRVERACPVYANETNGVWGPVTDVPRHRRNWQVQWTVLVVRLLGTAWRSAQIGYVEFPDLFPAQPDLPQPLKWTECGDRITSFNGRPESRLLPC